MIFQGFYLVFFVVIPMGLMVHFVILKGLSHQILWDLFFGLHGQVWPREGTQFFKFFCYSTDFWQPFQRFEVFNTKTSRRFLESQRWIYKCAQRFLEICYFLLGEALARCKFFSEMNLQFINIIVDTFFSKLADFISHLPACL